MKNEPLLINERYPKPEVGDKLKTSLRGSLKKESRLLKALLLAAAVAICFSFILEFWAGNVRHSQFFISLAIGVAGSAIISYLVLYFPFLDKKKAQINAISNSLLSSYNFFNNTLLTITADKLNNIHTANAELIFAQDAEEDIKQAIQLYTDADVHSDQIMEILTFYTSNLLPAVLLFEKLCKVVIEKYEKNYKLSTTQIQAYIDWTISKMKRCCRPADLLDLLRIFPNMEIDEDNLNLLMKVSTESFETSKLLLNMEIYEFFPR